MVLFIIGLVLLCIGMWNIDFDDLLSGRSRLFGCVVGVGMILLSYSFIVEFYSSK